MGLAPGLGFRLDRNPAIPLKAISSSRSVAPPSGIRSDLKATLLLVKVGTICVALMVMECAPAAKTSAFWLNRELPNARSGSAV